MSEKNEPYLVFEHKEEETDFSNFKLKENKKLSFGDTDSGNLLIHSDNLPALNMLKSEYEGKIKCCYLDPPYNTGTVFAHYDDSIDHGEWLYMMKTRLEAVLPLLKEDGVCAVQIGFDEMAYLKVMMDGIFGRTHCIGQIAVRMSHSAGMKRRASDRRMIKNTEYILIYYKDKPPVLHPLYEALSEYPVNYYQYIYRFPGENSGTGVYVSLVDVLYKEFTPLFHECGLSRKNTSIKTLFAKYSEVRRFIMENKDRVVRKDSNVPRTVDLSLLSGIMDNEYREVSGKDGKYLIGINSSGRAYQLYSIAPKVKSSEKIGIKSNENEVLTNLLGDWWDGFYRDMSRVDIEGGVKMKTSKKPERLLEWILEAATEQGDLVLDAFLGSGTTAAAALKMKRRFIGIEKGEQCRTLCLKRLRNVVSGEDAGGITSTQEWHGGGGFKFFEAE